jgi:phosphatidylserine decarboxylase
LAWKWQLGARRTVPAVVALSIAAGAIVWAVAAEVHMSLVLRAGIVWALAVVGGAACLALFFYRDPERRPPARDDVVVSPADGEVVYVRATSAGQLPVSTKHGRDYALEELTRTPLHARDAVVIGISMNFLDVHVNRAPIAGTVSRRRHAEGLFGSLRQPAMVFQNERATTVIESRGLEIAVVQIASRLVRRIVGFVREGDSIALGQRIGAIRFGSQVDVVLAVPEHFEVTVAPGDRVRAGESVLATVLLRDERASTAH